MKINLAGRDLTDYLIKLMGEAQREFSNIPEAERENAKDTKEKKVKYLLSLSVILSVILRLK